jgi:hypothetical protein
MTDDMLQQASRTIEKAERSTTRAEVSEDPWIRAYRGGPPQDLGAEEVLNALLKARRSRRQSGTNLLSASGPDTIARAGFALDLLSAIVPRRIANEEIGDALEVIHELAKAQRPRFFIYIKVITTYWWVLLHTLLHYGERVAGIVSLARGKGGDKE